MNFAQHECKRDDKQLIAQVVKDVLRRQHIELPSWAFGNSGTRFKVFAQPGVPRDPFEKVADAAQVHRYTGAAGSVSLHIPWDKVEDYGALAKHADDHGVRIGMINSNTFQDDDYKLGSLAHSVECRVVERQIALDLIAVEQQLPPARQICCQGDRAVVPRRRDNVVECSPLHSTRSTKIWILPPQASPTSQA